MRALGWLVLVSCLAFVGAGLDALAPPPSWKNPKLLCPTPAEQFAAQSMDLLSDYPVITKLGLLIELDELEKLATSVPDEPTAGKELKPDHGGRQADKEKTTKEKQSEPKEWSPEDYNAFWQKLSPGDRSLLGVEVEPRDGLEMPQGIWPIKKQWERFRKLPLQKRLVLLNRLAKLYWMSDSQRRRVLDNYSLWKNMSREHKATMSKALERWESLSQEKKKVLAGLYRKRKKATNH